ncbi:hypothetical protein [Streptomyces sp. NPDC055642]
MSESMAARHAIHTMDTDRATLAREARDAAEELLRFAEDVDGGIKTGRISRINQTMLQLTERAAHLKATMEMFELYEAERSFTADRDTEK